MVFKKENEPATDSDQPIEHSIEDDLSIKDTYRLMMRIIWLVPIKKLIIILMTVKVISKCLNLLFNLKIRHK
jgi:hypothetical protein